MAAAAMQTRPVLWGRSPNRRGGSDISATVTELSLAIVTGMGLGLEDLNAETMANLDTLGLLEPVPNFDPVLIGGDDPVPEDYIIVLEGGVADLPAEIQQQGNYLLLNRPELLQEEVFVFSRSVDGTNAVANYSLLGTPVRIPEPSIACLIAVAALGVMRRRVQ